ncbi:MAG: DUF3450 domain-containing protein [Bacteriovoracaceae bacterium]|nr:DUF3450 domain-containing protein [Bacteriovoracaceae bacterium]
MKLRDTRNGENAKRAFLLVVTLLLMPSAGANTKAISGLAQKIVDLRTEVENLNTQNNARKSELQSELKSLQARKAQLSAQTQQIELSIKQSQERLKTIKTELSKATLDGDTLVPLLKKEVIEVKKWVQSSLPFQKEKRLKDVTEIEEGLETGIINGQKALGKLWAFIEDELRLGRENGVHRQTLVIDGEENLVSVAKLGMVTLFYKTSDNRYGFTRKNEKGSFDYIPLKNKNEVEKVAKLFDGLKKQIRTGQYDIPNVF